MSVVSNIIRRAGPVGLYQLARQLTAGVPKILMYHRFSESPAPGYTSRASFSSQLAYLKRHYTVLSLSDIVRARRQGRAIAPNAVILTVDDGYVDFYSIAFPLLQESGLSATLFVSTGFINGDLWLWPDKVSWLLNRAEAIPTAARLGDVELQPQPLTAALRAHYWQCLIDTLLQVSDEEKHRMIEQLAQVLALALPQQAPDDYRPCSWQQLLEMQQAGIEIGGHTVTHPSLGRVSDEQARREINGCRDMLSQHLGEQQRPFCYPNGTVDDYTPSVEKIVEESGFIGAVAAFDDCRGIEDLFAMRRFPCGDDMFQFYKCVSGVQHLGNRVRNKVIN